MVFALRVLARVLILISFLVHYAEFAKFPPCHSHESCLRLDECAYMLDFIKQDNELTSDQKNWLNHRQCDLDSQASSYLDRIYVCCPEPGDVLPDVSTCGPRTLPTVRIYGGREVMINEFPWMARLLYQSPRFQGKPDSLCAGSLINNRYVLTAAHCILTWGLIESGTVVTSVGLGDWDPNESSNPDWSPYLELDVDQRIVHQGYRVGTKTHKNDIALLRMHLPVRFTTAIKPICVTTHHSWDTFSDNKRFKIAGWGQTEGGRSSSVLLKSSVKGRKPNVCKVRYGFWHESQLCAGGLGGRDTCLGDSGSPLMATIKVGAKKFVYLAGITSFGPLPCGSSGSPGVYTRTAAYTVWINENLRA